MQGISIYKNVYFQYLPNLLFVHFSHILYIFFIFHFVVMLDIEKKLFNNSVKMFSLQNCVLFLMYNKVFLCYILHTFWVEVICVFLLSPPYLLRSTKRKDTGGHLNSVSLSLIICQFFGGCSFYCKFYLIQLIKKLY